MPCSRSASPPASRSTPTSAATPCRSARWARSPAPPTGSGRGRSTWCPRPASANTAPRAARSAPTTAAGWCYAAWPATIPKSTRSGTATRAGGRSPTPASVTASPPRWCATTTATCGRHPGRRPSVGPPPRSRAPEPACWSAVASPPKTPTRTPNSPEWHWAPTTSTSGPVRSRPRRLISWPPTSPEGAASPTAISRPRRRCCWPGSNPRTNHRSSSCGCARQFANALCRYGRSRRSPPADRSNSPPG